MRYLYVVLAIYAVISLASCGGGVESERLRHENDSLRAVNSRIEEEARRQISLKVRLVGNICSIHVENYYTGEINFEDNLPVTDKDKNFHGFGMKSIARIVEHYGGALNVTATDELFVLDIAMPCRAKNLG